MIRRAPNLRALLVNDASLAGHHGSALVTSRIVHLSAGAGIEVAAGWSWDAALDTLSKTNAPFDLVIVNGEGSIHSNSRAAKRTALIALDLASRDSLPAYLVNATVEGNSPDLARDLGAFRMRFVRDQRSQAALTQCGVSADVVADLTLSAKSLPSANSGGVLLITDASDQKTTRRLIELAKGSPNARAITLRAPPPRPARGDSSRRIGFEIKRQVARFAPLSPWSLRYAGAVEHDSFVRRLASGARGMVCGRYHAVCFALRMALPFVALEGNTGKTAALLSDVGLETRFVDLASLERARGTLEIPPYSQLERHRIARFLSNVDTRAPDMFRKIAADAHSWHGIPVAAVEAVA